MEILLYFVLVLALVGDVLLAIGRPHEVAHGSLRLSLCEWNTDEDVDRILAAVPEVVAYLREMSPMWKDLISGRKPFIL